LSIDDCLVYLVDNERVKFSDAKRGNHIMSNLSGQPYITSDIAIAAYLVIYGFALIDCKRLPDGKFYFEFNDPQNMARLKSIEFVNSDCCKYDNQVRNLKKLLYKS